MVYRWTMSEDGDVDYEALRLRFPWVGLVDEDWGDVATWYREIMADALIDRRRSRRSTPSAVAHDSVALRLRAAHRHIATFNKKESQHQRCVRLLAEWPGRLLVPEPVLGETCNFLRNNVPRGAAAEIRFLRAMLDERGDFDIIDPVPEDRLRAAELADRLVTAPVG